MSEVSETGLITIAFSRPVFYELNRILADIDYTTEEKDIIAEGVIVDFITEND